MFFSTANVHLLRTKLQVHVSQHAPDDQLHAANSDRDVCPGHAGHLSARLHLYQATGHSPQERHDHEEQGLFLIH